MEVANNESKTPSVQEILLIHQKMFTIWTFYLVLSLPESVRCHQWLFYYKTGKRAIHYLDDLFFLAMIQWICNHLVGEFLQIRNQIKFPIAFDKTV